MAVLIVAATELEIAPFLPMAGSEIECLVHGIGSGSTSYHLTHRLCKSSFDMVLQTGIAGSYTNGPMLGESVIVAHDRYADLGIEENGCYIPLEKMGFASFNKHPFNNGQLINPWIEKMNEVDVRLVSGATVNLVHDDVNRTQKLVDQFNPEIETMEGAAFHQVCMMENVPFLQIRGISNVVGVRDKTEWIVHQAIQSATVLVEDVLMKLKTGKLWK
jgi:futalosine hydrolase